MNASSSLNILSRRINELRVESADTRRFIPENKIDTEVTKEWVKRILSDFTLIDPIEEIIDFIVNDAQKVFAILVMINNVNGIKRFIERDQLQRRHVDDLLPFAKSRLKDIFDDNYFEDLFYEKQWELCVPLFSGRIIPRSFDRQTILPYIAENPLSGGAHGSVYKIKIHPAHRPYGYEAVAEFVRKELAHDDSTYENEVRVLSTLQRLKHPNILRLLACYTFNDKHNLISPYIKGGSLRDLLDQESSSDLIFEELLNSVAGLASAIWALHEFAVEDAEPSHKGHHQDLRPDNVLVDGDVFILADFGLSSMKDMKETSKTPFKGRKGYCQAPECADLGRPFHEHETTRLADIFALGCIITDLLVYFVKGPSGVQMFRVDRKFRESPMSYFLYHCGRSPNKAVIEVLDEIANQHGKGSMKSIVQLTRQMLDIVPANRPSARQVTASLYVVIIMAFAEHFSALYVRLRRSPDAIIEEARFQSWVGAIDTELYLSSLDACFAGKIFASTVDHLRRMKRALENIEENESGSDCRVFLEVRILNTELISMLPQTRKSIANSRLASILLPMIGPEKGDAVFDALRNAFGNARITLLAETKQSIVQAEDPTGYLATKSFPELQGHIGYTQGPGQFKVARIRHDSQKQTHLTIVETIHYEDPLRREKLSPRVFALCNLLSDERLRHQLRIPPFYGMRDDPKSLCFELFYGFPVDPKDRESTVRPIALYELLQEPRSSEFPPLEVRLRLALDLAESLAAFHDVGWFHKNLSSFNVMFFSPPTRPPAEVSRPFLMGFQHSRRANDDFTEGPLQNRNYHRYHDPRYISVIDHQFTEFRPQFDYYSLGVLLLEIGFWETIDGIMSEHTNEDNFTFSTNVIEQKLPNLSFLMGSKYASIVKLCLTGLGKDQSNLDLDSERNLKASPNLSLKKKVIMPLKSFSFPSEPKREPDKKRSLADEDEWPLPSVKKNKIW